MTSRGHARVRLSRAGWTALALVAALVAALPAAGGSDDVPPVPVVDLSVHLPYQLVVRGGPVGRGHAQADPARLKRGGALGVVLPLVAMPADAKGELERPYQLLFRELGPSSGLRIPGCRRPGPGLRTWLALEDARELAAAPTRASLWVARGVRLFGLVGQRDNELGASAASSSPTIGLSARGREAVHAIHAAGGVVDVSNASERTTADVLAEARAVGAPVVASHANARALVDDPRNLSDASLRAIAASHGVIGITLHRRLLARGRDAELDDVVRHVRYVARVAGIDHVALGSGFESGARPPRELMNATRYPRLVRALVASGLDREQVKKVMAQNALRVLCPAQSLKHPPAR